MQCSLTRPKHFQAIPGPSRYHGLCHSEVSNVTCPSVKGCPRIQHQRANETMARSPSPDVPGSRGRRLPSRSPSPDVPAGGVWQCPGCCTLNAGKELFCTHCGIRRELQQVWHEGDWFCSECGNHNYWYRKECKFTWCPTVTWKPGDWTCPLCGNHNYSSKLFCNRRHPPCHFPKPGVLD